MSRRLIPGVAAKAIPPAAQPDRFRRRSGMRFAAYICSLWIVFLAPLSAPAQNADSNATATAHSALEEAKAPRKMHGHKSRSSIAEPRGKRGRALAASRQKAELSPYERWKMRLSFWPRKVVVFAELGILIVIGVVVGCILEETGAIRILGFLTYPITALGRLPRKAGPAFLFAFQSGALANSMLVNLRDRGQMDRRQLYTSVFVVSSLSLFAHLPTFIVPLGMAFGWAATGALFSVRFLAIFAQIVVVLCVSRAIRRALGPAADTADAPPDFKPEPRLPVTPTGGFWLRVWNRSWLTVRRLLLFLLPTFAVTTILERAEFFTWLANSLPGLFSLGRLPPESAAIIGAQAANLYNGAIVAANFTDSGAITVRQAVLILLTGTMLTAPIRTLKHSLSTYIAVLGLRPGTIMAVATQTSRTIFLLIFTVLLALMWK